MAPKQTVEVFLVRPGIDQAPKRILAMSREKLAFHSAAFEAFLKEWPVGEETHRQITLPEGSPAAISHVLKIIKEHNDRQALYIGLRDLTTSQKLAIWHACLILEIKPAEVTHAVGSHLGWVITHQHLTPEVMKATYDTCVNLRNDADRNKSKLWHAMVHQYCWDLIHGKFSKAEEEAFEDMYVKRWELGVAIDAKWQELSEKHGKYTAQLNENMRRRVNARVARGRNRRQKSVALSKEQRIEEMAAGLRAVDDKLLEEVIARRRENEARKKETEAQTAKKSGK